MVILLSAVGSSGKTWMAQRLLEKYMVPYLSMDHLKMGLYRGMKQSNFTPLDSTEVIGNELWPIIKGIIMTNIENQQDIIIEGCYVMPHYLESLEKQYTNEIIPVFFGFSNEYIEENFQAKIVKYRNVIESRNWDEERTIPDLIEEHQEFKNKCLEAKVPFFEIKEDYDEEIKVIFDFIAAEKRKLDRHE